MKSCAANKSSILYGKIVPICVTFGIGIYSHKEIKFIIPLNHSIKIPSFEIRIEFQVTISCLCRQRQSISWGE